MRVLRLLAAAVVSLVASGCGPTQVPCGPQNCVLCCTAAGACVDKSDPTCPSSGSNSNSKPPAVNPTPTADNTFVGTVGGRSLVVKEAFFYPYKYNGSVVGETLILSNVAGLCNEVRAGRMFPNITLVAMTSFYVDSTGSVQDANEGTFVVTANGNPTLGNWSYTAFTTTDASCATATTTTGSSGYVAFDVLDRFSSKLASGTFDITWGADRTTGKFKATLCDLPNNIPSALTCTQQ